MATHKYIYWRPDIEKDAEGNQFANVHLLVGYNQGTITDFQKMADELRETFPQAQDGKIHVGKVSDSRYVKNHSIIAWNAHIPVGDYPGWYQSPEGKSIEYGW